MVGQLSSLEIVSEKISMATKPIILISGSTGDKSSEFADFSLGLSMNYPNALIAAGGMRWVLPCQPKARFVAEAVSHADGVLLTGVDDIDPKLYTKNLPLNVAKTVRPVHEARDSFEIMLVKDKESLRQRKPMLCICRGHQILSSNPQLGVSLRRVEGAFAPEGSQSQHQSSQRT